MADSDFFGSLPLRPSNRPQPAFTPAPAPQPLQDWSELEQTMEEVEVRRPNGQILSPVTKNDCDSLLDYGITFDVMGTKVPARLQHVRQRLYEPSSFSDDEVMATKRIIDAIDFGLLSNGDLLEAPFLTFERAGLVTTERCEHRSLGHYDTVFQWAAGNMSTGYVPFGPVFLEDCMDSADFNPDIIAELPHLPFLLVDLAHLIHQPPQKSLEDARPMRWEWAEWENAENGAYCVNTLLRIIHTDIPEHRRVRYNLENEAVAFSIIMSHRRLDVYMHWNEGEKFYMSFIDSFKFQDLNDNERCGRVLRNIVKHAENLHWKMTGP